MRITSIENVVPGDVLGQDLYNSNGSILLRRGVKLTQKYIDSLEKLGLSTLYIVDNRLSDIKSPMSIHLNNLKGQLAKSFTAMNKRVDFGLGVGAALEVNHFLVSLNASWGLVKLKEYEYSKAKNVCYSLSVGYKF